MSVAPRRGPRLRAHAFEALIAALAVFSAVGFFVDPSALADTPIAQATGGARLFELAWNAGYGAAGAAILVGLAAFRPHVEVAGLVLLATANLMQTAAAAIAVGVTPFTATRQVATFVVVAGASLVRAHMLAIGEDVAVIRTVKDQR